jgi:predicted CoA-binding protein
MNTKNILQNSKTIAIIGCSPKEQRDSYKVAKYLQEQGYKIIPIHPNADEILSQKVYKNILDVKEHIDIVNIFVNSSLVPQIVEDVNKLDTKIIWSQLGIFNDEAFAKLENKTLIVDKCIKIEHKELFHNIKEEPYNTSCDMNFK